MRPVFRFADPIYDRSHPHHLYIPKYQDSKGVIRLDWNNEHKGEHIEVEHDFDIFKKFDALARELK